MGVAVAASILYLCYFLKKMCDEGMIFYRFVRKFIGMEQKKMIKLLEEYDGIRIYEIPGRK